MFDLLKWLDDAPIKLVRGAGNPLTGGCWMSVLSKYSGTSWSDHPECVDGTIRSLCIRCNDMISTHEERGRIIGPHLLAPVGTACDELAEQRRWMAVDAAVRIFAPHALRSAGLLREAEHLESLPEVTDKTAADAADAADAAADAGYAAADAADAAAYAADAAAYAAAAAGYAAADAADAAGYAAAYAADAAHDYFAEHTLLPVILRLCALGPHAPHEPSCDEMEMRRCLQVY